MAVPNKQVQRFQAEEEKRPDMHSYLIFFVGSAAAFCLVSWTRRVHHDGETLPGIQTGDFAEFRANKLRNLSFFQYLDGRNRGRNWYAPDPIRSVTSYNSSCT